MSSVDVSRDATDFRKRYSGVRMQQGRVLTDDDFNEAARLTAEDTRLTRLATIGPYGSSDAGFLPKNVHVVAGKPVLTLSAGSLYLGGLRLELREDELFQLQKDWLTFEDAIHRPSAPGAGSTRHDLVWIEAWEQAVTAVEDRELIEVALGGADTSTRVRTMRRVYIAPGVGTPVCREAWQALSASWAAQGSMADDMELRSSTRLAVSFTAPSSPGDLCSPAMAGGFLGAENQTIRVQAVGPDRYTWGYDNAAPLYRALLKSDAGARVRLELLTPPADAVHWPRAGQVIELLPWSAAQANGERVADLTGHLTKVSTTYDPDTQELTIVDQPPAGFDSRWQGRADQGTFYDGSAQERFVFVRMWARGEDVTSAASLPLSSGVLGQTGLSVTFSGSAPRAGDHWVIAARPAAPDVVTPWSLAETGGALARGVKRYRAPVALITWAPDGSATVHDCRPSFKPLTKQGCCIALTARPGPGWERVFAEIPPQGDADICFPAGDYPVSAPVTVDGKGRLTLQGVGPMTRFVGRGPESLLVFRNCDRVVMRDAYFFGGKIPQKWFFGGTSPKMGLGGTLIFLDVQEVVLHGIAVRNRARRVRDSACVRVESTFENARGRRRRTDIRGCTFYVGHLQIGVLVLNTQRVEIADNRFFASGPDVESVQNALDDERFRNALSQSALVWYDADQWPTVPGTRRVEVQVSNGLVRFACDEALRPFWLQVVKDYPALATMTISQRGLVRLRLMYKLRSVLASRTARQQDVSVRAWLDAIDGGANAVAGQAIVVGGRRADQVDIVSNEIHAAHQGIHVGLSHQALRTSGFADRITRVVVRENRVHCVPAAGGPGERHAVFLGNAQSAVLVDNYLTVTRGPGLRNLTVDGIRVFGFVGPFVQVRSNHVEDFAKPLNFQQRGPVPPSPSRVSIHNRPDVAL
jgi:hypothetical protein